MLHCHLGRYVVSTALYCTVQYYCAHDHPLTKLSSKQP
eukprot:COSAG06_NODE_4235_length_4443_cov_194.471915_2_plen_38_part_00